MKGVEILLKPLVLLHRKYKHLLIASHEATEFQNSKLLIKIQEIMTQIVEGKNCLAYIFKSYQRPLLGI